MDERRDNAPGRGGLGGIPGVRAPTRRVRQPGSCHEAHGDGICRHDVAHHAAAASGFLRTQRTPCASHDSARTHVRHAGTPMTSTSGNHRPHRRRLVPALAVFGCLVAVALVVRTNDYLRPRAERAGDILQSRLDLLQPPSTNWKRTATKSGAVDGALDRIVQASRGRTEALLVVHKGEIVYERYDRSLLVPASGPNTRFGLAAAAKGVIGSLILGLAIDDGVVGIDDPVSNRIPSLARDSIRSRLTLRHLATHSSGIEDVVFAEGNEGWKRTYFDNPDRRFSMAISEAPVLFTPGTEFQYSGVAYYVLAYALEKAFAERGVTDVRELLRERIMRPIGIGDSAWTISYGTSYAQDGLTLYPVGSGANLTARAAARIGEMLLRNGSWNGEQILSPGVVETLVRSGGAAKPNRSAGQPELPPSVGWWTNADGDWNAAPRDAYIAVGIEHQLVLVVPSLEIVAVRFGETMGEERQGIGFWADVERLFVNPLLEAFRTPAPG